MPYEDEVLYTDREIERYQVDEPCPRCGGPQKMTWAAAGDHRWMPLVPDCVARCDPDGN